jgi:DNA-binding XRE family transcriptional regulator
MFPGIWSMFQGTLDTSNFMCYAVPRNMPPLKEPDPWAARFGAVVRRMREQRHWTVAHLAQVTGYQPAHMSRIEHGRNVPTLYTILLIADVFGVQPSAIVAELEKGAGNEPVR